MTLIKFIEIMAILVGAFSGFIEARRKRMDLVGVFTVAFITAFGGGTLRDILLDRRPLFWVTHQEYAILIFVLALVAVAADPHAAPDRLRTPDRHRRRHRPGPVFDRRAWRPRWTRDMPIFIASMMGVITGIFGGVLRDIVCNEVPMVFRDGKPYAICAFLGSWMFLIMRQFEMPHDFALWSSATFITGLRLLTWKFDMRMGR